MPKSVDVSGLPQQAVQVVESLVRYLKKEEREKMAQPMTAKQLDTFFDSMSEGMEEIPELPERFSREDIYSDHD